MRTPLLAAANLDTVAGISRRLAYCLLKYDEESFSTIVEKVGSYGHLHGRLLAGSGLGEEGHLPGGATAGQLLDGAGGIEGELGQPVGEVAVLLGELVAGQALLRDLLRGEGDARDLGAVRGFAAEQTVEEPGQRAYYDGAGDAADLAADGAAEPRADNSAPNRSEGTKPGANDLIAANDVGGDGADGGAGGELGENALERLRRGTERAGDGLEDAIEALPEPAPKLLKGAPERVGDPRRDERRRDLRREAAEDIPGLGNEVPDAGQLAGEQAVEGVREQLLDALDGVVLQAVRLRLYPTASQAAAMREWIGAARGLWNFMLTLQKSTYETEKRFLSAKELDRERQHWEAEPGCEWRKAAPSHTRQRVVRELDKALRDFLKSKKGQRAGPRLGFPRFKGKAPSGSFYVANTRMVVGDGRVMLDKLGEMRARGGRAVTGRVLGARVRHTAGAWYLIVQTEAPPPRVYGKPSVDVIGVDVGLTNLAVRSDGKTVEAPRFFRKSERRMARIKRRVDKSQPGSRRRWTKQKHLARLQAAVRNRRSDFLHYVSSRIIGKGAVIVIEDLNIRGMARGRLAKGVTDAAMGELHRRVIYKADWSGREVVRAGRYEPTTKPCSECGQLHEMPLHRRTMRCDCGNVICRDVNAARNLARIGRERRKQVGEVIAEPAPSGEPTRVERGEQAAPAGPAAPVPVVETRRPRARKARTTPA